MKILIAISDSFCANFIKGQGKHLKSLGHEVVIVSMPGFEIDNLEKEEQVKIIRVPFAREISPMYDLKSLFRIMQVVRKEKPDIINAGNPKTGFLFSIAHIFFRDIPLIFTLRGVRSDTLTGIKKKIVRATEKFTCTMADKVISISPSLKNHALNIGLVKEKKCIVLSKGSSNGLDVDYYTDSPQIKTQVQKMIEKYKIPKEGFNILFIGRVTRDKGVAELLEAFQNCRALGANINLIIAGSVIEKQDPLPSEMYELLEKHPSIYYLGKQIDVRPIYSLGNVLVLYSYREGFGNVAIEASSFKLPTIVADIPGLKDTTINNKTGLVIEGRNSKELTQAILKLYNDRNLAQQLGQAGRERIERYFKNEIVWSKQLELYKELCE